MKIGFKIVFSLLLLCMLALPGAAWEQSFEGHPNDDSLSLFTGGTVTALDHGNSYYLTITNQPSWASFTINTGFTGNLGWSMRVTNPGPCNEVVQVSLTDINNNGYLTATFPYILYSSATTWHRYEIVEQTSGLGVDLYIDGVYQSSQTYSNPNHAAGKSIAINSMTYGPGGTQGYFDSFTSSSCMVDSDSSTIKTDTGQYYKPSYSPYTGTTWFAKTMAPDGRTYSNSPVSPDTEYLIPISFVNISGTYITKLYQNSSSGHAVPMSSRSFVLGSPDYKITTDKKDYAPGETVYIDSYAVSYTGCTVEVPYYDSSGTLKTSSYSLTSQEQTTKFTFPVTARGGSFIITLKDSNGAVKAGTQINCLASGGLTSLKIDKGTYAPNDMVKISYTGMPTGTQITIKVQKGNSVLASNSFSGISGSGVVTYQLTQTNADNFIVSAVSGNTMLGQTTGTIISGTYFLSGRIINPADGSLISGATIQIGTAATTSDSNGEYNLSVPAGWQDLSVTKTGYQPNINKVNIVYPVATQDFYLVKSYSGSGHSLYGLVTDYYTGAPVSSAYITLKQDSITHNLFSYTNSGYYIQDSEDMAGNWTVTVSKSGYYTSTQTISVSGDTYKQIILTPTKYSSTGDTGSSDSSGGDGGSGSGSDSGSGSSSSGSSTDGTSTDRPDQAAAKSSLDWLSGTMPNLIQLVVLVFMLTLIGVKL